MAEQLKELGDIYLDVMIIFHLMVLVKYRFLQVQQFFSDKILKDWQV